MKTNSFADLSALKNSTDLVAVVQARGIKLTKQGSDFVGLCPFHKEETPSFRVSPSKNLFHCFGCGAAGSVIDFVMKKDGLTKQQAIDWLVKQSGGAIHRADPLPPVSSSLSISDTERAKLLQRVAGFYAKTLLQDRDGFDYLKSRNLSDPTMLEVFQVGYCNGTLHKALPSCPPNGGKGGEIIEQLKAIGILNQYGRETFLGRVVVPIFDMTGAVCGFYGRRLTDDDPRHLYLKGERRGVWNGATAKTNQTLFITEAILDGMALWQAGFKNVISIYGTEGFSADHEQLLRDNGTTEVFLCLDNDQPGKVAAERLRGKISDMVKTVHVMEWPENVKDAAMFFSSHSAADFEKLIPTSSLSPQTMSDASKDAEEITMTADGFIAAYGARRYELRAVEKTSPARLKATVKCLSPATSNLSPRFHIDTVDFYLSRSRRVFIVEAARLFQEVPEVIELDVNRLITQLETYAAKRLEEKTPHITLVSEGDKAEALKLGKSPDLVREILKDMEKLGLVGEQSNGLLGYLAMTSRKMEDPLALLILSCSGAGKSHLQDTILSFCPEEDLVKVTSLSDQALYYKGEDALKHKVLAIEEEAGALGADYAIRNLISAKKLVREVTIKNPLTGKMETQTCRVNGPASVLKTTTNPETNAETRSRFFVTSVDESSEQTLAILAAQRQSHTLDGLLRKKQAAVVLTRQHAFQRLLKPLHVVNPFEPLLTYGDDRLLIRRDNPKYLRLILVVAFLHQMQRAIKTHPELGEFIEVTLDDIAIANDLALQLFGHSPEELSAPSRELLRLVVAQAEKSGFRNGSSEKFSFSRRELREAIGWSDARLRVHLSELVRLEYLFCLSGKMGSTYRYRLGGDPATFQSSGRFMAGLKSVETLQKEANLAGILGHPAGQNGHPAATPQVGSARFGRGVFHSQNGFKKSNLADFGGEHIPVLCKTGENGSRVSITEGGI